MDWLRARPWVAWYGLSVVVLIVGLVLVPSFAGAPLWSFIGTLGGTLCLLIAFGHQITNYAFGVLRDGQNGYSLSRLQMVAWTWLILSALIAVSAARLWHGTAGEALNIYIPLNLFIVMGISFFTGAASPALLSLKTQSSSTPQQLQTARARMDESQVVANGQVVVRPTTTAPQFGDLVEGDDLATAGTVDISKVQQLLITLLLLGVYFVTLCQLFRSTGLFGMSESDPLRTALIDQANLLCGYGSAEAAKAASCGKGWTAMPDFSASLVTLLAVSHGGYLAFKAAPRSAADNSGTTSAAGTNSAGLDPAKAAG
jgi:hypothetical protein